LSVWLRSEMALRTDIDDRLPIRIGQIFATFDLLFILGIDGIVYRC